MLGIDPAALRDRRPRPIRVIVRLMTETEPLTVRAEWFSLVDAVLQLRPYQHPTPPIAVTSMESPAGMRLAGELGAGGAVAHGRQGDRRQRRPAPPMGGGRTQRGRRRQARSTGAIGAW